MKRVLLLAMFLPPDTGGERGWYIAKALSKKGYNVIAVSNLQPHFKVGKNPEPWEFKDRVFIVRRPILNLGYRGFIRKFLMFASFMISIIPIIIKYGNKVDVIYSRGPHPFLDLPSLAYSKLKNKPLILDITDAWPETLIYLNYKNSFLKILILLGKLVNKYLFKEAKAVVTHTHNLARYLIRNYRLRKIKIVRGVIDTTTFRPMSKKDATVYIDDKTLRIILDMNGLIVVYTGIIGPFQDLRRILKIAPYLHNHRFLIIGEGEERERLIEEKNKAGILNVEFLGLIPHKYIPYYLSLADLCLLPLTNIPFLEISLPKKMLEYMACGKPIMYVGPKSEASFLIKKWKVGFVAEDEKELYTILNMLSKEDKTLITMGINARKIAEKVFSLDSVGEKLGNLLDEVSRS